MHLAPWMANFLFSGVAVYLWGRMVRELPLLPLSWRWWQERLNAIKVRILGK